MTIGSVSGATNITPIDRQALQQATAAERARAEVPAAPKVPFDPAPALRPTLQDKVDITRALLRMQRL